MYLLFTVFMGITGSMPIHDTGWDSFAGAIWVMILGLPWSVLLAWILKTSTFSLANALIILIVPVVFNALILYWIGSRVDSR